jgi:hypothetical protein
MPRSVEITVPAAQTDRVLARVRAVEGLIGLKLQRGVSLEPPGDVIQLETTGRSMPDLLRVLEEMGVGAGPESSISTNEPVTVISPSSSEAILSDDPESPWEEMQVQIARESNMSANGILLMAASGILAAVGIVSGTLHIVIAAMILAPGFEPVARVALGVVARTPDWRRGVSHTARGYAALIAGAAAAHLLLATTGLVTPENAYVSPDALVAQWTTLSWSSLATSSAAAVAGAIVLAAHRSVLTAGAMIGLALVPSAALIGMGLAAGNLDIAGRGLMRWGVEVVLLSAAALIVFGWKQRRLHRRRSMLR